MSTAVKLPMRLGAGSYSLIQKRSLMGFVRNALGLDPPPSPDDPTPENRFHPWDQSPCVDLRERAAKIRTLAKCPVTHKDINYTCPLSGIPTHHDKEAWLMDKDYHESKRYEILKKVNIYEHDLRSGRPFPEFDFPQDQDYDRLINLTNWDLFFYTRSFYSMDTEFQLAAVTKMLSYPITIGSLLHQFSPYSLNPKGPVTLEGLKSLAALRYTLYPYQNKSQNVKVNTRDRPMRIFILGARAEAQLPGHVWKQFQYLFPEQEFEIHFIGPECYLNKEKNQYITSSTPIVKKVDDTLKLVFHPDYFHVFHEAQDFFPYDPFLDVFFTFHPGYAYPETTEIWLGETMKALLDTKCAIFTTGFSKQDLLRDIDVVKNRYGNELDMLMDPVKNVFGSTKWELNDMNPQEVYQFNMYIAGFRGKRYHAIEV
ncbi:hypothetical protein Kpol_530p35 [Vanderwaltozyma polyspora DSM 70294]|uniref:Uncharacterized protein n=1 Tax=Vanderwaltozyma polyspora (strain ATCC 22028 / DSM 70294 / BCRC 21397 / CBS 2163 / NBRC 10782 / NRRL Y-8283 / UCD 57-17) TaxID=436907 RepID=A7TL09_VANPO|nr:uncharacterized protein Kpol_530p35 [Vanderwaltozyma polyspora DSM 70294]EDO17065.1 hypothetical protein Kpol_530p35 [Vanderwaltozyma polyspora DSM 70294]